MTENIKPISFMGYNLNELGEVEGAIPVVKHFTDELHDRIIQENEGYVYRQCMQLDIDPDVLKKQLIEIKRLNTIIREKDEQIEGMKCCGNCKHQYERKIEQGGRCKDHYSDSVCENYESDGMTADERLHNEWD